MMMQGIRKAGQTWLGKAVVTLLFGFLIVSFAVWGINDIFRGAPRNTVATVGSREISGEAFRTAYQQDLQYLMRQTRQSITPERARALGLDTQVLSRLVTDATLDQKARELGLAVSERLVATTVLDDPSLKGSDGRFNRAQFDEALRERGQREADFFREQRAALVRSQLAEALIGGLNVPLAMREAVHRYGAERRSAAYLMLPAAAAGEVPAPTDAELASFYEDRKGALRAPELRSFNALVLDAEALARGETVADDEARRRYESDKGRFGSPERRTIEQIVFPSLQEAEAAADKIKAGTGFEAVAAERNVDAKDLVLGTFAKPEMLDPAVADAAFALPQGGVSAPIQGRFGPVLIRVTQVQPEAVRPFEEVAAEIKRDIAQERARNRITETHDAVEDMRAGARPLAEIAREKNLPLVTIAGADRRGTDKAGKPVEALPDRDAVLDAVFKSDVGVDNEPVRTRSGGYVWFDVTGIEAARDRPLAEVRDEVVASWRTEEVARRLAERARTLVERLDKGEAIEALAGEVGAEAKTATDLARGTTKDELSGDVATRIFTVPVGKAGSAASGEAGRVIFKVTAAQAPALVTSTQEAASLDEQLRNLVGNDLLSSYIAQAQKEIGVAVNQQALRRAVGGEL